MTIPATGAISFFDIMDEQTNADGQGGFAVTQYGVELNGRRTGDNGAKIHEGTGALSGTAINHTSGSQVTVSSFRGTQRVLISWRQTNGSWSSGQVGAFNYTTYASYTGYQFNAAGSFGGSSGNVPNLGTTQSNITSTWTRYNTQNVGPGYASEPGFRGNTGSSLRGSVIAFYGTYAGGIFLVISSGSGSSGAYGNSSTSATYGFDKVMVHGNNGNINLRYNRSSATYNAQQSTTAMPGNPYGVEHEQWQFGSANSTNNTAVFNTSYATWGVITT